MKGGPTTKQLHAVLARIGSATSGKKDELVMRLRQDIKRPRLSTWGEDNKKTRILSIDMGIRNLAYCVADIVPRHMKQSIKLASKPEFEMNVSAWRRMDVGEENVRIASSSPTAIPPISEHGEDKEDPYTPSALSKTAHTLVSQTFLPYRPDIILIERQRWRSASSAAIQQWTVRVNMLEGMLWAVLTAFRDQNFPFQTQTPKSMHEYRILGVDPKRVGNFWISQEMRDQGEQHIAVDSAIKESSVRKLGRGKMEKKAKIELLRSWITDTPLSTSNATYPAITFTFSPDAERTRAALCSTKAAKEKGKVKSAESKKMDDVTDCFLQAAAWVAWEGNRLHMLNHEWDDERECLSDENEVEGVYQDKEKKRETIIPRKGTRKKATMVT